MWSYNIKGTKIEVKNINEARELVEEIRQLANETATDLSKGLNDFCFAVEVDYQNYHSLDPDDWNMINHNG